jgi:LytS/YehU family sensor histidine kinase
MSEHLRPVTTALLPFGNIHVPEVVPPDDEDLTRSRTRAAFTLTLVFWLSGYFLQTLTTALAGTARLFAISAVRIGSTMIGLGFCYLIHLLLSRPQLSTTRRRLVALAIVSPVFAEIYAWAAYLPAVLIDPSLNHGITWSGSVQTISFWTWFFLAWSGLYLALTYSFDVRSEQLRSAELRERAHVAQLRALHSQINPHFLFNSLNSVSALILDNKGEQAEEMVAKLSRFLRLGLSADPTRTIPLSLEIELQQSYLEIQQVRYPDLAISICLPPDISELPVPALILQPIVENAVKYGVSGSPSAATIEINAQRKDGILVLEVKDSGGGNAATGGVGIGLSNVRQCLALMYGEGRSDLEAGRQPDGTYRAQIRIPVSQS